MKFTRSVLATTAFAALALGATTALAAPAPAAPNTTPQKVCGSADDGLSAEAVATALGTTRSGFVDEKGQHFDSGSGGAEVSGRGGIFTKSDGAGPSSQAGPLLQVVRRMPGLSCAGPGERPQRPERPPGVLEDDGRVQPRLPAHGGGELSPRAIGAGGADGDRGCGDHCFGCGHGDGSGDCGGDGEDGGGAQGPLQHGEAPISGCDGMCLDRRHLSGVRASSEGRGRLPRTGEAAAAGVPPVLVNIDPGPAPDLAGQVTAGVSTGREG